MNEILFGAGLAGRQRVPCLEPRPNRSLQGLAENRAECEPRRTMARSPDSPLFPVPPVPSSRSGPDFSEEEAARAAGLWPVAGLDEAGRGPLAGPVVAAAVVLDPRNIPDGLDDSKKLSAGTRERLFDAVLESALAVSLCSISAEGIDRCNILRASLAAMRRALLGLAVPPGFALVDGRDIPPALPCKAKALVGGDGRSQSVAAASIVAKVTRDRMMTACGSHDARFGFERHMGYGTARHRAAIECHGAAPRLHRLTFAPLKARCIEAAGE